MSNGNSEAEIQNAIFAECGHEPDVTLWRNNTGQAEEPVTTREHLERFLTLISRGDVPGVVGSIRELLKQRPRYVRYGLCPGSSDIIGIVHAKGLFVALEVKTAKGRVSDEQQRFLDHVNRMGGVAGVVRSPADAWALINWARRL